MNIILQMGFNYGYRDLEKARFLGVLQIDGLHIGEISLSLFELISSNSDRNLLRIVN